jgi:hypothetical protein
MEMLNGVLALDPEGVIEMAWEVVISGRPHGFNLDSLAIEQVVKITESILADYRLQTRVDTALGQILEIIEIFSETGCRRRFALSGDWTRSIGSFISSPAVSKSQ